MKKRKHIEVTLRGKKKNPGEVTASSARWRLSSAFSRRRMPE